MTDTYQGTRQWVESETGPRRFTLKDGNVAFDLTSATVAIVLRKADDTLVGTPGTVAVITALSGIIEYTPFDANVFLAKNAPYRAHFKVTKAAKDYFFPGKPEAWEVYKQ